MKRVLIIAPHFPPSNLAAVHRTRLFAQHLPEFGWEPIVLTVHHSFYEEGLDWNLAALVPDGLRVERVGALPTRPVRVVGDIGVRGFFPLLRRALQVIDRERIDFVYIPIPSHFAAPLGRAIHRLRGVPYGIDYIDPWVHEWPGTERPFTRHWASRRLGGLLEPLAVRDATLITGVAEGYYADVLERNPHLRDQAVTVAMPYGGERSDHVRVRELGIDPYLFKRDDATFQFLYAGALLPQAHEPLRRVLRAIADHRDLFRNVVFHFVGCGTSPTDPEGYNVRPVAEEFGLWGDVVTEHPARIPYLDVLAHLEAADGVFVLGSTEPHYTPSKVYQGVLSDRPIFAVLHQDSTACDVVRETGVGTVLAFDGERDVDRIETDFADGFRAFRQFAESYDATGVDRAAFDAYSARSVTQTLATALDKATTRS